MWSIKGDMEGALKEYFSEQSKLEGKCLVDFVQFDDTYEVVYEDTPVADAGVSLNPRGSTALLDALGKTINNLGKKLKALPEAHRPGIVQVVVVTDGYENSSSEFTPAAIKKLVTNQTDKYQWDFVYLGANQDAIAEAGKYGFAAGKTMTYDPGKVGSTVSTLNSYTTRSRMAGSSVGTEFTDAERAENV